MKKINVFIHEIFKTYPITKSNLTTVILFIGMVSFDIYTIEAPLLFSTIVPNAEDWIKIKKNENNKYGFESTISQIEYLKSMNTSKITKIVSTPTIMTMRVILRQMLPITF